MKWNKSNQKCVTCEFWGGSRNVVQFGRYVEAENMQEKGACLHPTSASKYIDNKNSTDTCPKWEAWRVLV